MNSKRVEAIQEMLIQAGDLNTLAERIDARLMELEGHKPYVRSEQPEDKPEKSHETCKFEGHLANEEYPCDNCYQFNKWQSKDKPSLSDKCLHCGHERGLHFDHHLKCLVDDSPQGFKCICTGFAPIPKEDKPVCQKCEETGRVVEFNELEINPKIPFIGNKKCDCQANKDIRELDLDNKAIIHNVHTLAKKINEPVRAVNKQGKEEGG